METFQSSSRFTAYKQMLDLEKDDLNIVGGHCGFLTYPNSTFLSNLTTILKIALLIPYMCPWFWRKQNRTCYKRIVFSCFGASGNSWRADAHLLCLTQNFLSIEKRLSRGYFSKLLKGKENKPLLLPLNYHQELLPSQFFFSPGFFLSYKFAIL